MHNNRKNYDNLYVSNIFLNKKSNILHLLFIIPSHPILTQTYYWLSITHWLSITQWLSITLWLSITQW